MILVALSLGFQEFPNLAISYFFKDDLHLDLTQMSFYNSLLNFIWVLKPVFGFIVDSYPIFGSHRRSYLIIFSLLGSTGWLMFGLWVSTLGQAMFTKTLINVSTSFCNVIGEGIMVTSAQKITEKRRTVSSENGESETVVSYDSEKVTTNVSLYLSLTSFSSIISQYLGGHLLGVLGSNQKIFLISASLPVMTLVAGLVTTEPVRLAVD